MECHDPRLGLVSAWAVIDNTLHGSGPQVHVSDTIQIGAPAVGRLCLGEGGLGKPWSFFLQPMLVEVCKSQSLPVHLPWLAPVIRQKHENFRGVVRYRCSERTPLTLLFGLAIRLPRCNAAAGFFCTCQTESFSLKAS